MHKESKNHGGKRPGAGRPVVPPDKRGVLISSRVPQYVVDALQAAADANGTTLSTAIKVTLMIWADEGRGS